MTEQEINTAIAESMGWELRSNGKTPMWSWINPDGSEPRWKSDKNMAYQNVIPDYCNDLNAMREVEMNASNNMFDYDQWSEYGRLLNEYHPTALIDPTDSFFDRDADIADIATSTAKQRAIAYLKTINKYK